MKQAYGLLVSSGLIFLTSAAGSFLAQAQSNPLIRPTNYGEIEGIAVESRFGDEIIHTYAWLGIPYAQAPVGELRWKAPRAPEKWEGIKQTKEFGSSCTQFGGLMSIMNCEDVGKLIGGESCLYLNIWRPATEQEGLPVFFWIHGGGNTVGQAAMSLYHGANFAGKTNLVFVSLNYRLGPLGWFALPALRTGEALDDSGNFGTLDIIQALTWVKQNIAFFGGDPNHVTIAGESAGGVNVYSLLASPLAAGLFHQAISQSGAPFFTDLESGEERAEKVLHQLLINDGHANSPEGAQRFLRDQEKAWIAAYLRSKSAEEIFACYEKGTFGTVNGSSQLFVDGTVLVMSPGKSLKSGDYHQVPFLAGNNKEEAKLFLPLMIGDIAEVSLCRMIQDIDPDHPQVKLSDYLSPLDRVIYNPIGRLSGIGFQFVGVDVPAKRMARHQEGIYAYRFDWDEEPAPLDYVIGAGHGVEIAFVFGNFQADPDSVLRFAWSEANRGGRLELSERMMTYWANFARTGNPNGAGLPEWKPYSKRPGAPKRILLDAE